MSETLNINVLVAAKEEYTKQLVYILSPEIYIVLKNIYNESQQMKKKRSISLRNYQILLKRIPVWNTILIEQHTKDIKSKIPYLLDLITAIFVSHVKILACVRLKADSKSIQVKVPNLDVFLHKIIITNAEKIYYNPEIILKKKEIVIELISETIEETIRNQIPIDKILTEYLAGVFDEDETDGKINGNLPEINNDNEEEELEELEEESDSDESLEHDAEDKNIVPTRPLPSMQLPESGESVKSTECPEDKIPTTEINMPQTDKQRVLFSDAVEKSIKEPREQKGTNEEEDYESESDSEVDYGNDDDSD
jgi:hypothetical protein